MNASQVQREHGALRCGLQRWSNAVSVDRYRAVQICVACLLLAAGGLKTHQLVTEPVLGSTLLDSRWFLIAVVEFELLFAFWLLSGVFSFATWRVTVALFAVFSLVSLYKAVSGEASCGCFGGVSVNPWFTFALDILVLAVLLLSRPTSHNGRRNADNSCAREHRLAILFSGWLLVGVPAGTAMASYQPATLGDVGELLGDGRTVLLKPEGWVGEHFPLLEWIRTHANLDRGRWTVVLYRSGCPACEETLPRYWGRANGTRDPVALIGVSSHQDEIGSSADIYTSVVWGHLSDRYEWLVRTPFEIRVVAGKVVSCGTPKTPGQ